MSALRALKKLRAGAGQDMDDAERDKLVKELKDARDKLREGKLAKSEMIVKSCRQAGLHTLPESNGILDAILAKGSHKNMVRTVAYDPVSKQLKTCVTKDTYDAANEFIQKGGIEAFRSASGDLMSVLLDFNTVWNETEKLIKPYVVGTHYKKAEALKYEEGAKKGQTIMVKGADGNEHPINSCKASATEQECYARRTSLAGKAGDACVWMPNFAHLDDQIVNSGVVLERDWRKLQSDVCVHQGDMPLPMRDATQVDQTALRSGRQLKVDSTRAMGSSGRMLKLNAKAYEKPRKLPTKGSNPANAEYSTIVPDNVFQLRYPQFSIVTPFGTTKKMPYVFKRVKGQNKKVEKITTTNDKAEKSASRMQKAVRARLLQKKDKLPQSVKNKLRKVQERSAEIRVATKEQLQYQYSDKREFSKAVEEALEKNPKYVSQTDQEDYAVYHLAKAGAFSQADVNALMSTAQNLGDRGTIAVATDDVSVSQAWTGLFNNTNSGLSSEELDLLKERLANPYGGDRRTELNKLDSAQNLDADSGVKNSNDVYYATQKNDANKLGKLADFLSGGGDTSGKMLPVQMPPRHSAANDRMFVTFNHGPMDLFGGGLMKDSAPGAHVGEDKAYPKDFERIKATEANNGKITVPAAGSTNNPQLFFLTRYALLLLKANTAKYAPMLHNYYAGLRAKNTTNAAAATRGTDLGDLDADTVAWMRAFGSLKTGDGFYGESDPAKQADAYKLFIKEKLDDTDLDNTSKAINLLLNTPAGAQRNAYDEANDNDFALNTTTGVKTRETDKMRKYTYDFPVGLANIQLLEALSLRRAGDDNDESLLVYLFGKQAYTTYDKAPEFIAWARKQFAKGNGAPVAMSVQGGGTKYDGTNADAATALPAFVSTPPFEFPCEYANARALNALDKPGDYDTKQFKNDGAVGDAQDPGQTMANIGSGQAAANIVAGTAKESDRYAAYKQWAAYNKTQMQDIKTIAGLLSKHVSLQAHRAQAFAVIKAVPFVRVNCPP